MSISYQLDLTKFDENTVALLMVQNVITREEFEQWRANKTEPITVKIPEIHLPSRSE